MKPVVFHPEARLELAAAGRAYAEKGATLAQRFFAGMAEVIAEACARPTLRRMFDPPAGPIRRGYVSPFTLSEVDVRSRCSSRRGSPGPFRSMIFG